jgi:hypothetical protein
MGKEDDGECQKEGEAMYRLHSSRRTTTGEAVNRRARRCDCFSARLLLLLRQWWADYYSLIKLLILHINGQLTPTHASSLSAKDAALAPVWPGVKFKREREQHKLTVGKKQKTAFVALGKAARKGEPDDLWVQLANCGTSEFAPYIQTCTTQPGAFPFSRHTRAGSRRFDSLACCVLPAYVVFG